MVLKINQKTYVTQWDYKKINLHYEPKLQNMFVYFILCIFKMNMPLDTSSLTLINKTMLNKISYKLTNSIFWIVEFVCEGDSTGERFKELWQVLILYQNRLENLRLKCNKISQICANELYK